MADDRAERHVVFHARWVDTTRHGFMRDHEPSPEPVPLLPAAYAAAMASGKATAWPADDAENGAETTGDHPEAD